MSNSSQNHMDINAIQSRLSQQDSVIGQLLNGQQQMMQTLTALTQRLGQLNLNSALPEQVSASSAASRPPMAIDEKSVNAPAPAPAPRPAPATPPSAKKKVVAAAKPVKKGYTPPVAPTSRGKKACRCKPLAKVTSPGTGCLGCVCVKKYQQNCNRDCGCEMDCHNAPFEGQDETGAEVEDGEESDD